jgi:nucleoside-diphosphate-sugar epimerase
LERFEKLDREGNLPKKVNLIYDLAAYGNLAGHESLPEMTYQANTQRVAKIINEIIERSKLGKKIKFIYVSTSSVSLPTQTFYSASKKATEEMIKLAVRDFGIDAVIVRPYTVIGQGEHLEHLIPKLINSCMWGTEIPFVESPVHDFIDVEDFVDALITVSKNGKSGEVYEIGSGKQTTNLKIKKIVEKIVGYPAKVKVVKSIRNYDTKTWKANINKIKKLGWKPTTTIEESIRSMVPDYLPL